MSDKPFCPLTLLSRLWLSCLALSVMSVVVGCSCLWLVPGNTISAQPADDLLAQPYHARYLEAQLLIKNGHPEPARRRLEQLSGQADCPPAILATLAELYILEENGESALKLMTRAIENDSGQARFYLVRAELYRSTEELDKALADLEVAAGLQPGRQSVLEAISDIYMERIKHVSREDQLIREVQGLIGLYERMLKGHTGVDRLPPLMILSSLYNRQEAYDKAAECAQQAIELMPDDARPYLIMAEAQEKLNQPGQALTALGQALRLEPQNEKTLNHILKTLASDENLPSLLQYLTELAGDHPANKDLQDLLITRLLNQRQWDQAETALGAYLETWPNDLEGRISLMRVWLATGREDLAIDEARRLNKEHGAVAPPVAVAIATGLFGSGQAERAIELLEEFLAENPGNETLAVTLAQFQIEMGHPERATEVLKPQVQRNPANLIATVLLAQAYANQGQYEAVNQMLDQLPEKVQKDFADELKTLRSNIYLTQGVHHQELGENDQAEHYYRKAIELNPEDPETYNSLGYFFAETGGDLNEAYSLIQHALELSPDTGHIVDSLGWILFLKGEYDQAINQLEKAVILLNVTPDPVIFDHLGDAYEQAGRVDKAREAWQKAHELNPTATSAMQKLQRTEGKKSH